MRRGTSSGTRPSPAPPISSTRSTTRPPTTRRPIPTPAGHRRADRRLVERRGHGQERRRLGSRPPVLRRHRGLDLQPAERHREAPRCSWVRRRRISATSPPPGCGSSRRCRTCDDPQALEIARGMLGDLGVHSRRRHQQPGRRAGGRRRRGLPVRRSWRRRARTAGGAAPRRARRREGTGAVLPRRDGLPGEALRRGAQPPRGRGRQRARQESGLGAARCSTWHWEE